MRPPDSDCWDAKLERFVPMVHRPITRIVTGGLADAYAGRPYIGTESGLPLGKEPTIADLHASLKALGLLR